MIDKLNLLSFSILLTFLFSCSDKTTEAEKIFAINAMEDDFFGSSLSLSVNRAIVGASSADLTSNDGGAVYIYEFMDDSAWVEVAILSSFLPDMSYGYDVSISGDRAIIGVPMNRNNGLVKPSARIVERRENGRWEEVFSIETPMNTFSNNFATAVSLSGDRALIGAPMQFIPETDGNPGIVYVFERSKNGEWLEVDRLIASDPDQDDRFGNDISLSGDRAIIGAPRDDENGEDAGAAYIFERQQDGSWLEEAKISTAGSDAKFGTSVSISGDRVVIGAPWYLYEGTAFIFERNPSGEWEEIALLQPSEGSPNSFRPENIRFGNDVSLFENKALVGSHFHNNKNGIEGAAYLFELQENAEWKGRKINYPGTTTTSWFGYSVALSEEHILVGAPEALNDEGVVTGAAYFFKN